MTSKTDRMTEPLARHIDRTVARSRDAVTSALIAPAIGTFVRVEGLELCGYRMSWEAVAEVEKFVVRYMAKKPGPTATELAAAVVNEFDLVDYR